MSTILTDSAMSAALWIVIKVTLVLGTAAIVQALLRRRISAATRHLVWTLAIIGVLVLPVLSLGLPDWALVIRTVPTSNHPSPAVERVEESGSVPVSDAPVIVDTDPAPPARDTFSVSWPPVLGSLYAAGAVALLIQLTIQRRRVRRLAQLADEVQDPAWRRLFADCAGRIGVHRVVRLLRSRESSIPMAFSTRRPSILIPAIAETWPDDRRRAVLLHELAHVARHDCLTQTLAFVACAAYWFHPGVWWVARRLRIEREFACDDRVIAAGTQGREYAGHLLEIAYAAGGHRAPALAISMARPRQLEGRLLAAIDAARHRGLPPYKIRVAAAAITGGLLVALAAARPMVVAADAPVERAATAVSTAEPQQNVVGPTLKPVEGPLIDAARRIVRVAAEAMGIAQSNVPGTWEIRPTRTEGIVHLRLAELDSNSGSNVPIAALEGLRAAQLAGSGGPVQFRIRRDAGTLTFEGVLRNGVGAGTFSFILNPNFPAELAARGFARPTDHEQYQLARHDIGYAFLDELNKQGYGKPEIAELVRAGQHGVHATYLREMGALGYRFGSLDPLITLRDHGITPAYVRELADQGYKGLPADELRRARDHGITPDYVRGMRDAGYGSVPMDELIRARDHGVTTEFVRELGDAGHRKLPLDELIRVRDHGVKPEYVREMRQLGYALPLTELVEARDHGITIDFVREMAALGYGKLPMASLVRLRDHGVTPKYVQDLKALGYDRLSADDLVTLRDHGLTADRVRAANTRAGTRLPVDLLKSLAAGGMR